MGRVVTGNTLGESICAALGIDHTNVSQVTITARAGDVAEVHILRLVDEDFEAKLLALLAKTEPAERSI